MGYSWVFTAAARPSPTRQHYLARREDGDGRPGALLHLFNKLLGQLHHCLAAGHTYDLTKAWPPTKTCNASNADQAAALHARNIGGLKRSVVLWVKEATK